ncbi:hypothetical protein S7711_10927 [Stachybotrys chartarum IBT 7711]|uniref:Uncharacterized protein n=1 Tax=Stachybotrys chartarum (strain CBS 109288 / IBT 7711) TaxID=1280523 RepID=A0A084ANF7_STACB|nr:hypothetical protein S7711_10927 [Stachybotrys chartarum IBT 7711]
MLSLDADPALEKPETAASRLFAGCDDGNRSLDAQLGGGDKDPPTRDKPEAVRRTGTTDDSSNSSGSLLQQETGMRAVVGGSSSGSSSSSKRGLLRALATTASRRTHAQAAGAWASASYRMDWTNQPAFSHHSVSVRNVKKGPTVPPRGAPGMCEKRSVIVVAPPQAKSQRWPIAAVAGVRLWERPAWQCWHTTQEITGGCVPPDLWFRECISRPLPSYASSSSCLFRALCLANSRPLSPTTCTTNRAHGRNLPVTTHGRQNVVVQSIREPLASRLIDDFGDAGPPPYRTYKLSHAREVWLIPQPYCGWPLAKLPINSITGTIPQRQEFLPGKLN